MWVAVANVIMRPFRPGHRHDNSTATHRAVPFLAVAKTAAWGIPALMNSGGAPLHDLCSDGPPKSRLSTTDFAWPTTISSNSSSRWTSTKRTLRSRASTPVCPAWSRRRLRYRWSDGQHGQAFGRWQSPRGLDQGGAGLGQGVDRRCGAAHQPLPSERTNR